MHGFTCGIGDLLLTDAANAQRSRNIARGEGLGLKAACQFAERDPSGTRSMVRNKRLSVLAPLLARMRRVAFGRGASGGPPWPGSEGARRHHTHRPRCVVLTTIVPPHSPASRCVSATIDCTGTLTDLRDALRKRLEKDGHWGAAAAELDGVMVGAVMPLTSQVIYPLLPHTLPSPAPHTHTPP